MRWRTFLRSVQAGGLATTPEMNDQQPHAPLVSATEPDWRRERLRFGEWNPGKRLLRSIRDHQRWSQRGALGFPVRGWASLRHRFWSVVTGADIPLNCVLGGGLILPHPNGVVIHPGARVGPNCLIFQQVTLGTLESGGTPVVGGHVDIGAGAKLLGPVVVGDHAVVGANAVVVTDVPAHHTAIGVPARCRARKSPPPDAVAEPREN